MSANTERNILYDPHGNILSLTRWDDQGVATGYDYRYDGNRLDSLVTTDGSYGFEYDESGNMTFDGRKELSFTYNALGLPETVTNSSTGVVLAKFSYLCDGTKLRSQDVAGGTVYDYLDGNVYVDGRLESAPFAEGRWVTTTGTSSRELKGHIYVRDHLGSTRAIVANGVPIDGKDYLPFGKPWERADAPTSDNRYLFNGKESQAHVGVNYLDYGARMYDPDLGRWTAQDPLAEKYYGVSSYAYCNNNPVRYVDPTGMDWEDREETEELKEDVQNKIVELNENISRDQAKLAEEGLGERRMDNIAERISDNQYRVSNLNQGLANIDRLGADQTNTYAFNRVDGSGAHHVSLGENGTVRIDTSTNAMSLHEITHIIQSLDAGGLVFEGGLLTNPGVDVPSKSENEIKAYQMQYSYDRSFPGALNGRGINGIDVHSVGAIRNPETGQAVYPFIENHSKWLKNRDMILGPQ